MIKLFLWALLEKIWDGGWAADEKIKQFYWGMQIGKLGDKETRRYLDCWCINSGSVVVVVVVVFVFEKFRWLTFLSHISVFPSYFVHILAWSQLHLTLKTNVYFWCLKADQNYFTVSGC